MIRTMVLPFVIKAQKNVTRLNNNMPQMQVLQEKMSDARRRGDMYDSAVLGQEMQKFMKEKNIDPIKNIVPIMFQLPFFMSMFLGLRGMANLPLESMMSGGLYWFKDMTVPDPFYVLPALVSATLFLQIRIGADGMSSSGMGPMVQQGLKVVPVILFFLTMNFPSVRNIVQLKDFRSIYFTRFVNLIYLLVNHLIAGTYLLLAYNESHICNSGQGFAYRRNS